MIPFSTEFSKPTTKNGMLYKRFFERDLDTVRSENAEKMNKTKNERIQCTAFIR